MEWLGVGLAWGHIRTELKGKMIGQSTTVTDEKSSNLPFHESLSRRLLILNSDKLCAEARRRTGLDDFGDPAIESRLSKLVDSLESEAQLHSMGRFLARMHVRNLLETRLRLTAACKNLGDLGGERIERPIFVTGMPRSGSTFLHELFAQNPANRAPLVWEVMFPPSRPAEETDEGDRGIRQADRCLWWFKQIAPRASAAHPIQATSPHECVTIHSYSMLSQEFATTFRIPGYAAFLDSTDLRPAYAWEKLFLQYLQSGGPARRWVLKAPDHVFSMDALFGIFPDAVVIQMHRNPIEVLKSSLNLTEVLREMFAHPDHSKETRLREAQILADGLDRITRFRDANPALAGRFIDVHYQQLVTEPLATLRQLHWQLDLPWTTAAAEHVQQFASSRSRYRPAGRKPALADLSIDPLAEAGRFAYYCSRFGITPA